MAKKIQAMVDSQANYVCKMKIYAGTQPDGLHKIDKSALSMVTRLIVKVRDVPKLRLRLRLWYTD